MPTANKRFTAPQKLQPRRDRVGRYMIPDPDTGKDKAWTRATTIAKILSETYNLQRWSERMVAKGIGTRRDLYALASATDIDDKDALNRICEQAKDAVAAGGKANLGTALHAFTERFDRGEALESIAAPEPWCDDLAAYIEQMNQSGVIVEEEMIERIITNHEFGIAGTFDRLVRVPGFDLPMIADLKTTSKDIYFTAYQEFAIQFAIYANADTMWDLATQTHLPMPEVDRKRALVIHLPVGEARCHLHLLDIEAGWEALQHAMWVRSWQKRRDLNQPLLVEEQQQLLN